MAVNHKVEFIPLAVHENAAECHVVIKTTSKYQPNIDVGAALVSLGFATVTSPPVGLTDKLTAQYFKFLKHKEETARKSRNGVWTLTLVDFNNCLSLIFNRFVILVNPNRLGLLK